MAKDRTTLQEWREKLPIIDSTSCKVLVSPSICISISTCVSVNERARDGFAKAFCKA